MESPSLTPSGGEFLSQLGKTWNLIQSKAKELDKAKKKQRKTEEELVAAKDSCEQLRSKEQLALSKIAELESATLVLSSENSRLKKDSYNKDEQIEDLTSEMASKDKLLQKKKKELSNLAKDNQEKAQEIKSLGNTNAELEDAVLSMKKDFDKKCKQWSKFESDVQEEHSRTQDQLKELQIEKEELGRHLWHVMEELKACERRVVEMQQNGEEYVKKESKLMEEIESLQKEIQAGKAREKGQAEQLEALKKDVGETLNAARTKQNETVDELNSVKNMLSATMQAKSDLETNLQTMRQDMKKVKDVAMDQVQNTKSAFQEKLNKALEKEEEKRGDIARELQVTVEQLNTLKKVKQTLTENIESKRNELKASREEVTAVRKETAEVSNRLQRATKEQESIRKAMDKEVKDRDKQIRELRQEVLIYTDENNRLKELSSVSNKFMEQDLQKATAKSEELEAKNDQIMKELNDTKETLKATMETMNSFKDEVAEKIKSSKKIADDATKNAKIESEKAERLSTMLHALEEKLKKSEFDKSQQIGSLTENIGVHTQQLNKRVEECNRLRNDLAMAKTHNESLQETIDKLTSHVQQLETKRDEEANTLRESLDRLQMTEEEMINAKQTADETANLLQELHNEVKDQKHTNKQLRQKLEKVLEEKNLIKQDAASQILAFSERNKDLTNELQDLLGIKAKLTAELKKKSETVEDAVSTITELRGELSNAEEDAESTIEQLSQKLMAVEKDFESVRAAREKEARDNAKAMAKHTARLGQLQKALDESNWELDTMKRDINQATRDKEDLEQKVQRLQRDNASLKKVESNMNGFLKNMIGEKENGRQSHSMGLTPLRLNKTTNHSSSSKSSRSLSSGERQNSSRSSNGGNSARSSSSAPDKLHGRNSYTPDSSSKSYKNSSRPSSGSRSRPSSGSRSRPSSAKRNKDHNNSKHQQKERYYDENATSKNNATEDDLVLPALPAVGEDVAANVIQRTADFLKSRNKNRGASSHSTRPLSANNQLIEDDIVFSKRRSKRLNSLDKENMPSNKINRAKSAAGRRRQDRSYDSNKGPLSKKIRPLRKDRPNSAPMQQTPKRVTIGIRSEKKPQRTQSNAPFKPVEDDLEDSEESVEERMERVIYNPKKRNFGNNNRYERPSRSHNKTFVTKQSQASTPGSGKNPYDLLGKYSNNRDEYADSYYNSNTPRHLSPPTIY
eukprot:g9242.t1